MVSLNEKHCAVSNSRPDHLNCCSFCCCFITTGTAGILAVGGSKPSVVATDSGLIGVKKVMNVNLTADHRIVYGADAAEFLQSLKAVIENPDSLTL